MVPRLFMLLIVTVAEYCIQHVVCRKLKVQSKGVLWIFNTSWTALVIAARPFSNAAEMWMIVMLMTITVRDDINVIEIYFERKLG